MKQTTTTFFTFLILTSFHKSFTIEIFDKNFALHFTHTIGSHFGQSISLYSQNSGIGSNENVVLAGAPLESIPGAKILRTGNTLKCPINLHSNNASGCQGLDLSGILTSNDVTSMGDVTNFIEEKKGMLMGTSLYTSSVSGQIITCGPLYKTLTVDDIEHPIGLCHVLKGVDATSDIVSPCNKDDCSQAAGIPRLHYGYCMAGFSATFFSLGEEVLLGGPGRGYFQGAGFKGRDADCSDQTTPMDALPSFGFAGYSVTTGRVFNRNEESLILSAPRANLFGEILTYSNSTLHSLQSLSLVSSLRGSYSGYLGYALLAVDINGDGLDEILASEPLYSDMDARLIEIGRVVVIGASNGTSQLEVLFNFTAPFPVPFSRFGTAISLIGDLDKDGYPEIAISAPYTPNGGTVFIYRATMDGLNTVPIQILSAANYAPIGTSLKSFGFSLASQVDIDNNGYFDLLIGAPLSDRVVLIRSHRLVRINAIFNSTVRVVNIKSAEKCDVIVSGEVNSFGCFEITYNFSYIGWPAPSWIILDTNITVDVARSSEGLDTRGFFVERGVQIESTRETFNITEGEINVVTKRVYLSETIFQLATPLEFLAKFEIIDSVRKDYFGSAVIIEPQPMQSYGDIHLININCGPDNKCEPELKLTANYSFVPDRITNKIPESLTPGKVREFQISLEVSNVGEEASRPEVRFNHSKEVSYRTVLNTLSVVTDIHVSNTVVILSLGNSIEQGEKYSIVVVFTTTRDIPDVDFITMEIEFFSENVLGDPLLVPTQITLSIPVRTELNIISNAINYRDTTHKTENLYIPSADNSNQDVDIVGLSTIHQYTVRNLGPWSGNSSFSLTLTIYWPIGNIVSNEFYLYLTRIQATEAVCEQSFINRLNFYIPNTSSRRRRNTNSISDIIRKVRQSIQAPEVNGNIIVDCREDTTYCVEIQCFINPLEVGQTASIVISSNLYEPTLTKLSPFGAWNLTSFAFLKVSSAADVTTILQENSFVTTTATVESGSGPSNNGPPWYIYVIPTVILVVMGIALAIVILYLIEHLRAKKKKREHRPLHENNQIDSESPVGGEDEI